MSWLQINEEEEDISAGTGKRPSSFTVYLAWRYGLSFEASTME
jgi:hypothetical protein